MLNRKQIRKFTLIELLVVISIISILMTLLLPSLKKAKDMSRKTLCASNLKQVGTLHQMYVMDHDEYWVRAAWSGGDVSMSKWWYKLWKEGYAKEWDVVSVQGVYTDAPKLACTEKREIGGSYSYAMASGSGGISAVGGYYYDNASRPEYTKDSQVKNHSRKIAVLESFVDSVRWEEAQINNYADPVTAGYPEREQYSSACHLNGSNFLFADGHVNWHKKRWLTWSTARDLFGIQY